MSSLAMRCTACKSWIVWGIRNARPHPYNADFDEKGRAHQGSSHFLTCPYADNWLPKRYRTIWARADRDTENKQRWRRSCDSFLKYYTQLDWSRVTIHDVPDRHAIRIATKLTEKGGPYEAWHSLELVPHCLAVAVSDRKVR